MADIDNDPLGVFGASVEVTPIESLPPQGGSEHRRETRYRVTWKADVIVEGEDLHDGRLNDISLHGAAILNELKHGGFVESRRGNKGGYILARSAEELTVGEIFEYIQETVAASFRQLRNDGHRLASGLITQIVQNALRETFQVFEGYAE